jgi:hypothetical protein
MSVLSVMTLKTVKPLALWRDDEGPSVVTATCTLPDLTVLISSGSRRATSRSQPSVGYMLS